MRVEDSKRLEHSKKIVAAQLAMREDISLLVVQGVDSKKAYTFKVSRDHAITISHKMAYGEVVLAVIEHAGRLHVKRALNVIINPNDQDLSFPMRWIRQVLDGCQFQPLKDVEVAHIKAGGQ